MHGSLSKYITCSKKQTVAREWSSRANESFGEQITSKDNYSCIFPKPKVVYCLSYPSNISSHSKSSGTKQNKTWSKTLQLLVLSGIAFPTSFLISSSVNWRKTLHFKVCLADRHYWLITPACGSRVTIPPIMHERKCLMDYDGAYSGE